MKRILLVLALLAALPSFAAADPQGPAASPVLVEVDGHAIGADDLKLSSLLLGGVADTLTADRVRDLVLGHLVDLRLAADAALAEGADPTLVRMAAATVADKVAPPPEDEGTEARERRLAYLELSGLAETYFKRRESGLGLDEASLRARYDALAASREIRFRYLVADDREKVEAARRRISLGEPFEKVAAEVSADPDTAKKGGDLGYLLENALTPAFADLAGRLEPGRMSEIFRTEMGWNVAMLVDRRKVTVQPFEKMRAAMRKTMVEDMRRRLLADLRARAKVVWHAPRPAGY